MGDTACDFYFSEALYPECHQTQEADEVCRGPSDQCQDHICKEDKATPSQMDHPCRSPRLADTNRVVTSQGRYELKTRPQRQLSVMSPRESLHTEETLPTVPLGNSKLKGVTTPPQIALLIPTPKHPLKVKYSLITITAVQ